jgi:hypothetical protein
VITKNQEVILLAIYDKAEKENLSPSELDDLLREI